MVCTRRICTIYAVALPARKIFRNDEDEDDVVIRIRRYILSDNRFLVSFRFSPLCEIFIKKIIPFPFLVKKRLHSSGTCSCRTKSAGRSSKNESRFTFYSIFMDRFWPDATLHIFRSLSIYIYIIYIYKYFLEYFSMIYILCKLRSSYSIKGPKWTD